MWGIARIDLSPLTQKIVGCVIGENVTTEYPWVYVRKEIIEDNIDLHSESSDFLPVKDEIHAFPEEKMLIGYAPSLTKDAQFYICLTQESKDAVARLIQEQRQEHEDRVRVAVFRPVGRWLDWGSGAEVDAEVVKNTRPLFEIEVSARLSWTTFKTQPTSSVLNMAWLSSNGFVTFHPAVAKLRAPTRDSHVIRPPWHSRNRAL